MKVRFFVILILSSILGTMCAGISRAEGGRSFNPPDARNVPQGKTQVVFGRLFLPVLSFQDFKGDINPQGVVSNRTFSAALQICDETTATACIKSVEIGIKDPITQIVNWESGTVMPRVAQRTWVDGKIVGNDWQPRLTSTWKEDLSRNLPEGSESRFWKLPAGHAGGNMYYVGASLSGEMSSDSNGRVSISDFKTYIAPLTSRPVFASESNPNPCPLGFFLDGGWRSSSGDCLEFYDFPENTIYRIQIRLGSFYEQLSGWLDGRIVEPEISISGKENLMSISGAPTRIPVAVTTPKSIDELQKTPEVCFLLGCNSDWFKQRLDMNRSFGVSTFYEGNSQGVVATFEKMLPILQERAAGMIDAWSASLLRQSRDFSGCLSGGFSGVISSNAAVYEPIPPSWNLASGALDFKIGAPHLDSQGKVLRGYYSLKLSSLQAKCLWGADYVNAKASVSIIDSDGTQEVETVALNEKNGWLNFLASGFHFSSPTIRVQLTLPTRELPKQSVGPVSTVTSVPEPLPNKEIETPKKSISLKKTITCTKGKLTKKITGLAPKCPTGYKKK